MRTTTLCAGAVTLLLAGCGTSGSALPDRAADVTGVVAAPSADLPWDEPSLARASDAYYEGMPLRLADAVVVDADGTDVEAPAEGDTVEVWIGDGCAESSPVQCEIVALRVQG